MKKTLLFTAIITLGGLFPSMAQSPSAGEEIDLGLSVNWRGYNIGAEAPQQSGTSYAYAMIKKGNYNKYNYPFFSFEMGACDFPVNDISGNMEYDAAAAITGGLWRMPTKEEWQELIDGCTASVYTCEGINGILMTSKSNGNSIFLPYNGYNCNYYTANNENGGAYYFYGYGNYIQIRLQERFGMDGPWTGMVLRPVCDKDQVPLESISLTADRNDIFVNTFAQLTAVGVPADAKFKAEYSSSDENVATVTDKGLVKGIGGGTAVITATAGDISATVTINVTAVETDLSAASVDLGLGVDWCTLNEGASSFGQTGDKYAFCITSQQTYANALTYPYYNGSYRFPQAEFSGNPSYDVIAKNHGQESRMRLPSKSELEELVEKCCAEPVEIEGVKYMRLTSTVNGKYILLPIDGTSEYYHSGSTNESRSEAYCLSLSATGSSIGAFVKTNSQPYKSRPLRGVMEHIVIPDLTAIILNKTEASIYTENTVQITAKPEPLGAELSGIQWSSSDEAVATVDANGLVTGVSAGVATITAAVGEIKATVTVTVEEPNVCTDEMVDMGLDVMWAPCELGAATPSESGKLYYWGALEPTENVSDKTKWVDPGIDKIGATEFDVAYKTMGDGWRMPKRSDLLRLSQNATFEWIVYGGRKGVLVISNLTGKRMFWPLQNGETDIFYCGDELFRNNSSDGEPLVTGLWVTGEGVDELNRKPWTPMLIRPVFDPSFVPPLTAITITSESTSLDIDGTLQLTAVPAPEKAEFTNLTWASSDETVATVDANGLVTGLAKGTATITAADGEISATIEITVNTPPLTAIAVTSESTTLYIDGTLQLTAVPTPEKAEFTNLTWASSDETVATVDANGLVTGLAKGTATITAADGEISATIEITVNTPPLTAIAVTSESTTLYIDGTLQLTAVPTPEKAEFTNLTWASSDETVATVDANGLVTGLAKGIAIITVADGDISATIEVSVMTPPVEQIVITSEATTLNVGETLQLSANPMPENAVFTDLVWTSSLPAVATVDANGLVSAVSKGIVVITASDGDINATIELTITDTSSVAEIITGSDIKEIYTTDGRKVSVEFENLSSGFYIIVKSDGTVIKTVKR